MVVCGWNEIVRRGRWGRREKRGKLSFFWIEVKEAGEIFGGFK